MPYSSQVLTHPRELGKQQYSAYHVLKNYSSQFHIASMYLSLLFGQTEKGIGEKGKDILSSLLSGDWFFAHLVHEHLQVGQHMCQQGSISGTSIICPQSIPLLPLLSLLFRFKSYLRSHSKTYGPRTTACKLNLSTFMYWRYKLIGTKPHAKQKLIRQAASTGMRQIYCFSIIYGEWKTSFFQSK